MSRILLSWVALENDFTKGKLPVNDAGPNSHVHKYYYEYDKHVLLTSAKDTMSDTMYQHLVAHLRGTYRHQIEERAMAIGPKDVINLEVISSAINNLLLTEYRNNEIDIFISPGTPTMQVAWYMAHLNLGLSTRLFQLRRPEHSGSEKSEQVWVTVEKSSYTSALIIKQKTLDQKTGASERILVDTLKPVYRKAEKIAAADHVRVLISGETGTGKEVLAKYIHKNSPRANKKFVAINCSALSDQLLESRLFGYMKGAFTGAIENTRGLFHEADGGTVFLDEIGDISPYMQQSLLRFFPDGEILRVGSRETEKVNVRVIAATNKDLPKMCAEGKFREDLYYRLAVSELFLPPLKNYSLKERDEIFLYIWGKCRKKFNTYPSKLPVDIKKRILEYPFPGNIREMENVIEGIIAEAEDKILMEHLPKRILNPQGLGSLKLKDVVYRHIKSVYEMCDCNIISTAKTIGVSPNTVVTKLNLRDGKANKASGKEKYSKGSYRKER